MKPLSLILATLAIQIAQPLAAHAALPEYRLTLLDFGAGHSPFSIKGMNNAGTIAGTTYDQATGRYEAFFYQSGNFRRLNIPGSVDSSVIDLNERGEILGTARTAEGRTLNFIYRDGQARPIPLPPGAQRLDMLQDLNNKGHVLGYARMGGSVVQPFLYDGHRSRLLDADTAAPVRFATFNDQDEILGEIELNAGADTQPVIYRDGRLTQLPPLPDDPPLREVPSLRLTALNNAGQALITGVGTISHDTEAYTFIYDQGQYTPVGGYFFFGTDMNEKGWAVGVQASDAAEPPPQRVGLFIGGEFADLANVVRPSDLQGWTSLANAYAIDDRGRILGRGDRASGDSRYFLATPVPEAGTAALMLAGLGAVGLALRRRRTAP